METFRRFFSRHYLRWLYKPISLQRDGNIQLVILGFAAVVALQTHFPAKGWKLLSKKPDIGIFVVFFTNPFPCKGMETLK